MIGAINMGLQSNNYLTTNIDSTEEKFSNILLFPASIGGNFTWPILLKGGKKKENLWNLGLSLQLELLIRHIFDNPNEWILPRSMLVIKYLTGQTCGLGPDA